MVKKNKPQLIAMSAPVAITAEEGESKGPPKFSVVAYTGGALNLGGWDAPVVVDLAGISFGKSLVANLDHDGSKRVGNVTGTDKSDGQLILSGTASAATEARREVVESAAGGFVWQASIEAQPDQLTEVKAGKSIEVNGQTFNGPLYVAAKSTLKGFAFVSHGADDNTTVKIAATAAQTKEPNMDPKLKSWIEAMGFDVDELTTEQVAGLKANYDGNQAPKEKPKKTSNPFEARKIEAARREEISDIADEFMSRPDIDSEAITAIEDMHNHAIESGMTPKDFRYGLIESRVPMGGPVNRGRNRGDRMTNRVLEAAICLSGRLTDVEERFDDQTLQAAHDRFPRGIGLGQLLLIGAEANGYNARHSSEITLDAQRAAFGMAGPQSIHASAFSTLSIPNVLAATANKFLHEGWMAVDMTPLNIAAVRSVRNFQQITTVSLTGHLQFEQLGASGEIKHGELGDLTYTNQADTYAKMLAITRKDIINDDLSALTAVPRRLGRGGALKLNDIFWTEFLDNSAFFAAGNSNVSTDTGTLDVTGLSQAEVIFMNQTDPDSKPLGAMPKILLVPTALKTAAYTLMNSEKLIDGTATGTQGDANVWRGRFRVESSPYMSNSAYTGYSAAAWYLLADPGDIPVIEIAALNGNVMPVVETADADFNVLGIQMRGYSDVGVNLQEYRGGVRADGTAAD